MPESCTDQANQLAHGTADREAERVKDIREKYERRYIYTCRNCGHRGEDKLPAEMVTWVQVCSDCGDLIL